MERKPEPHDLLVALLLVQSLLERRSETFFHPFGLTSAQFNILNLLANHDGQLDQSALVEMLLVGKSSLSIVITRMVRDGLVRRVEHAKDRRQTVLHLTSKGNSLWRRILPNYESGVNKVFGALPPPRRKLFLNDLRMLHDALMEDTGNSPDVSEKHWRSYLFPSRKGGS